MPVPAVTLLLFAIFASGLLLAGSFRLKLRHDAHYLDLYFYFITITICYGLLNWVGPVFLAEFGKLVPPDATVNAVIVIVVSAVPLALARLLLFVVLLLAVLERKLRRWLIYTFVALCVLLMIWILQLLRSDTSFEALQTLKPYLQLISATIFITDYLAIAYFLSRTRLLEDPAVRKHGRHFGWAYLVGFFVYAGSFYLAPGAGLEAGPALSPYFYFLLHFPPMLALRHFADAQRQLSAATMQHSLEPIEDLLERAGVSKREKQVLELLLTGENNQAIADRLFISSNTVRNHIYSLYGKLEVSNRIQLITLCSGRRQRGATN